LSITTGTFQGGAAGLCCARFAINATSGPFTVCQTVPFAASAGIGNGGRCTVDCAKQEKDESRHREGSSKKWRPHDDAPRTLNDTGKFASVDFETALKLVEPEKVYLIFKTLPSAGEKENGVVSLP
jgi:hypothetical protein